MKTMSKLKDGKRIVIKGKYVCANCLKEHWGAAWVHKDYPYNHRVCPKCYEENQKET